MSLEPNRDGLKVRVASIEEAVEYAERNGGIIKAKAKGNHRFSSTERPKNVILPESISDPDEHLIVKVARLIVEVFGR